MQSSKVLIFLDHNIKSGSSSDSEINSSYIKFNCDGTENTDSFFNNTVSEFVEIKTQIQDGADEAVIIEQDSTENRIMENTEINSFEFRHDQNSVTIDNEQLINSLPLSSQNNYSHSSDLRNNNNFEKNDSEISFSSTNSSLYNQSYLRNLQNDDSLEDGINIKELRKLFSEILDHLDSLQTQIDSEKLKSEKIISDLESKIKKNYKKNNILMRELDDTYNELYDQMYYLDCRVIRIEQYTRRESLIISGIPEIISQAELEPTVLEILRSFGIINLASYHISACHRLSKKYNDPYPARTVVRFTNRKVVEYCIEHRDRLREIKPFNMNLRFFNSLCDANEQILSECKRLLKFHQIEKYYLRNGSIKIIKNGEFKPKKINHINELYILYKEFYDYEELYMN